MAKLNVFALLNAFTGSFVSYFRLFRCFDSIRFNSFNFRFTFRFDSSGILVYLLSLRSEGGCETDQTNDCVQVNLFINNGSVFNFALRYVSFITVTVNPRGIYRMTASTALTTVAPSTQRCKAYERSCAK